MVTNTDKTVHKLNYIKEIVIKHEKNAFFKPNNYDRRTI